MADLIETHVRRQLLDRKEKLEQARTVLADNEQIAHLLGQVDAALARLDHGSYGLCASCHEPIEADRLLADPLLEYCIDHLTVVQRQALEDDLNLAARIQSALLPPRKIGLHGWDVSYHYEGAGPVSGDYCDVLAAESAVYFVVGDVTGKGVGASMLSAHLHASFRALMSMNLSLQDLVARASRAFCESTLPTHFATIVYGRADRDGLVEICNAGHHPPLLSTASGVRPIDATGLPLGLFCDERFTIARHTLARGDAILLYTDGLCEAESASGAEYGASRIAALAGRHRDRDAAGLVGECIADHRRFLDGRPHADDLTIMVVRRAA